MRKAADQAETQGAEGQQPGAAEASPKKGKAKAPAAPKAKKPRKKKEPPRMCARWGVFDAAMKQVAVFDYNQRAEAETKRAELASKKNAMYFLQIVKEPVPEAPEPEAAPV